MTVFYMKGKAGLKLVTTYASAAVQLKLLNLSEHRAFQPESFSQ